MAKTPAEQAAEADRLIAELNKPADNQGEQPNEQVSGDGHPVVQDPPAKAGDDQVAALQRELDAAKEQIRAADQRWRVAQGIAEAKTRDVEAMREMWAQAQQAAPAQEPAPAKQQHLTEADRETYGDDMIDVIRRTVRDEFETEIASLKATNAQLVERLQQMTGTVKTVAEKVVRTDQEKFYDTIDELCPDWTTINDTPAFLDWLGEVEPLVGVSRQDLLRDAYGRLDGVRAAQFFTQWKALSGTQAPPTQANPNQGSVLEEMVSPGRSKATGNAGNNTQEKRTWTPATIAKFYSDVRNGKYSAEERDRLERDMISAQAEGRFRPG